MITENLSTLKIHKLTQQQYDRELAAGRIDKNALYLTPEEEIDLSPYAKNTDVLDALNHKADKSQAIFYIVGTGDTAGTWLGVHSDISEYYNGLTIAYQVGIAGGSSATTLNINGLGAVSVIKNVSSAITTHYGVGSVIILVYTIIDGTACWKIADYDSDTKTCSSNKTGSKMYIIGATSQSTSGQTTYSNKNCYIGTDNCLYSSGAKVALESATLPLAGGTMNASAVIKFNSTAGEITSDDYMGITYGRISSKGNLCLNADHDNSNNQHIILTSGKGTSSSTADGLAIGANTLTWKNANVLTESNYTTYIPSETWTFVLEDGSTITRTVHIDS